MQFFRDFLLVVNSLTDQQQKKQTSERSSIVFFVILFLQRLSLLFPQDGYNKGLYQDVFLYLIYRFVSPFNVASILQIWGDATLIYIMIILIALLNFFMFLTLVLLTILYRLELYDPLLPKEVLQIVSKIVYQYIMYLEYTLYIPMVSILMGSINCGIMSSTSNCLQAVIYGVVIFALVFLVTMTFITVYFFRTYKYWPENTLKKKFSQVALLMPLVNFLHIYMNYQGGNSSNNIIKLLFANMMGIIWIYELYTVAPYVPTLNSIMFYFAILYEVVTVVLSLGVGSNFQIISIQNLAVFFLFYGSLVLYLCSPIRQHYEIFLLRQKNLNQFQTISLIQLINHKQKTMINKINNKSSPSDIILWHFAIINHDQNCNMMKCNNQRVIQSKKKVQDFHGITKNFTECVLVTELNIMKKRKNCFYEQLELFYISFQNDECNDSLPAFCQLKLYQQREQIHSFQFKSMKDSLNLQLKNKIIQRQNTFQKIISNDIQDKQLTTTQIYQCEILREKYISQFQEVIDMKISYWVNLINGFNNISDYSNQIIKLSKRTMEIKIQLEKDLRTNLNETFKPTTDTNVLILKILSIYFALAINDYEFCLICEDQIDENLRTELSFSSDLVFNANMMKDQVVLLSISTMKNRGQLIYKNKHQISKYFGYNEIKDFDKINHVGQLMPDFVKEIHDSIITNFLAKGSSDRFIKAKMLFLKDCDGFLFPANQKIQNFFEQSDDYVLTAEFNKIREYNDFILFDSYGQILGITKNLYALMTKDSINSNLKLDKLLNSYIFLLIPNIVSIIEKHISQLNLSDTEVFQQEEQTFFNIPNDFLKLCDEFRQFYQDHKLHHNPKQKLYKIFQTQIKSKFTISDSSKTVDVMEKVDRKHNTSERQIQNCSIELLSKEYYEIIEDFMSHIKEKIQKQEQTQYMIRNILEFRKIGAGDNIFPFFFLEITDFKHLHDNLQTSTMNESHFQDYLSNSNQSALKEDEKLTKDPFSTKPQPLHYSFKDGLILKRAMSQEDYIPADLKLADISEIQESRDLQVQDIPGFETVRFSHLMQPQSMRHTFIPPVSQQNRGQVLEDYINIENDFKNLQDNQSVNVDYSQNKSGINQTNLDQINTITRRGLLKNIKESVEEFDIINLDEHHSSKKNENSHQIQKVFDRHRRDIVHNEPEVNQSNSSRTSMTAKRGTLDIIKGLRSRTKFNRDLSQLSWVYTTLVMFILIQIIVSVVLNNSNASLLMNGIKNIAQPQKYANEYFTIFTCGWLNLAQKLNIIGLSNYMQSQILNQTQTFRLKLNQEMLARYQIFAVLEDQGKLDRLNITYLDQPSVKNVEFGVFFFVTLDKLNAIINLDFDNPQPDTQFVMDLLYLRENLGQIIKVNQDLIATISNVYNQDIKFIEQQVVTQFIVFICLGSFLVLIPLILWRRFQFTQQRILMFNSRVHQRPAQQMLLKFLVAKDVIQQNGQTKWKIFNYFDLIYHPIEEADYLTAKMDIRQYQAIIFPEKSSKSITTIIYYYIEKSSNNHNSKSTLLSSRISQTNVRGTLEIIFTLMILVGLIIYLVGGYVLLVNQETLRAPSENLVLQQVKYQNQFDTFMVTGLLAKTQFLIQPLLIQRNFITENRQETLKNIYLNTTDFVIDNFVLSFVYSQKQLISIWKLILADKLLQDQKKVTMLNIFQISLCINLYNTLPFCRIKDMGEQAFQKTYGYYDEVDDDSRFVNTGIVAIVSGIFQKVKEDFNYEISNHSYQQNATVLQSYMGSREFFNIFVSYFQDYQEAYNLIQDMILQQIEYILHSGQQTVQLYYLAAGLCFLLMLCIFFVYWLEKKNKIIQFLRMGITNIPIEVLFEAQMMTMLKQLDRE